LGELQGGIRFQSHRLSGGIDVLVATAGRLLASIKEGVVGLTQLKFVVGDLFCGGTFIHPPPQVIDEADRMLVAGFAESMRDFFSHPDMPAVGARQTLMFSATFPHGVQKVAHDFLHPQFALLAVDEIGCANKCITQMVGGGRGLLHRANGEMAVSTAGGELHSISVRLKWLLIAGGGSAEVGEEGEAAGAGEGRSRAVQSHRFVFLFSWCKSIKVPRKSEESPEASIFSDRI
jgi:hypothetical protein